MIRAAYARTCGLRKPPHPQNFQRVLRSYAADARETSTGRWVPRLVSCLFLQVLTLQYARRMRTPPRRTSDTLCGGRHMAQRPPPPLPSRLLRTGLSSGREAYLRLSVTAMYVRMYGVWVWQPHTISCEPHAQQCRPSAPRGKLRPLRPVRETLLCCVAGAELPALLALRGGGGRRSFFAGRE